MKLSWLPRETQRAHHTSHSIIFIYCLGLFCVILITDTVPWNKDTNCVTEKRKRQAKVVPVAHRRSAQEPYCLSLGRSGGLGSTVMSESVWVASRCEDVIDLGICISTVVTRGGSEKCALARCAIVNVGDFPKTTKMMMTVG